MRPNGRLKMPTLEDRCKLATECLPVAEYRRRLEALHAELLADAKRLNWLERQHLEELSMQLVVDAKHDGHYYVCGDSNKAGYGPTLRAAIDAAMLAG